MGNVSSCGLLGSVSASAAGDAVVKLVHCNGMVDEFYRVVRVNELTVDYPHHAIFNISGVPRSHGNGKIMARGPPVAVVTPMGDHDHMQLGHVYFLLPHGLDDCVKLDMPALLSKARVAREAVYRDLRTQILQINSLDILPPPPSPPSALRHTTDAQPSASASPLQLHHPPDIPSAPALNFSSPHLQLPQTGPCHKHSVFSRSFSGTWRPSLQTIEETVAS